MGSVLLTLALSGGGQAHGFCGTYIGSAGSSLTNARSEVIISRSGQQTTMTMANDVGSDVEDFAMLVPVPEILEADDVTLVDKDVLRRIDTYTAPRLVSYTCSSFYGHGDSGWHHGDRGGRGCFRGCGFGDKGSSFSDTALGSAEDTGPSWADAIEVESSFAVGEYEIEVISADTAEALIAWADDQGYAIADDAEEVLARYIEAGVYFFAAKVSLESLPADNPFLSPLQFSYESPVMTLPISLGALNADGEQDLVVTVINDYSEGQAHISNMPEREVLDECMWSPVGEDDFADLYTQQLDASFSAADDGEGGWVLEYSWDGGKCDPCPDPGFLSDEDLSSVGWLRGSTEAYVSRLRVRYTPEQAADDLVFYHSKITDQTQTRFIEYNQQLEVEFPICGDGWVTEDPGNCDEDEPSAKRESAPPNRHLGALPGVFGFITLVGAVSLTRRRLGAER